MTNNEATNGKAKLQAWEPTLTVDLLPDTANAGQFHTHAMLRVNHPSYAAAVIMAEPGEVDSWIAGAPILAHPAPTMTVLYAGDKI
jgi:hypothetical protein